MKIYGLDQTKITFEKIGKNKKVRYWDDTKKDAVFPIIKLDDAVR